MKVILLASSVVISLLLPWSASAQAYFEFTNRMLLLGIDAPVFDAQGVPLAGTNYLAELYGGPSPDALIPAIDEVERKRLPVPFRIQGYFGTTRGLIIISVPGRGWAWLQVRAWDARLGATYEEAVARGLGGYGESPLFYARGNTPGHLDAPEPVIGLRSFRLRPVTPAVLVRNLRREGNRVVIELNPGFKRYQLQQTSALGQPWQNVGEPTSATSVTNSISGNAQFFRVVALLD